MFKTVSPSTIEVKNVFHMFQNKMRHTSWFRSHAKQRKEIKSNFNKCFIFWAESPTQFFPKTKH